jgi:hypothetical protein
MGAGTWVHVPIGRVLMPVSENKCVFEYANTGIFLARPIPTNLKIPWIYFR